MPKKLAYLRSEFNYDGDEVSRETGLSDFGPSLTVQSQKDEADINTIVRNFGVTGQVPQNVRVPMYGDFTGVGDYRQALDAVRTAEESFMKLPAEFRAELDNDPQRFLEFCADEANLDRMRKLGLAVPAAVPDVVVEPAPAT